MVADRPAWQVIDQFPHTRERPAAPERADDLVVGSIPASRVWLREPSSRRGGVPINPRIPGDRDTLERLGGIRIFNRFQNKPPSAIVHVNADQSLHAMMD